MPFLLANYRKNHLNKPLALLLDYDGTLSPIVKNPAEAFIEEAHLSQLLELAKIPQLHLAIISGRSLKQLKGFLKPLWEKNVVFCGLHGGEIKWPQNKSPLSKIPTADLERNREVLSHFKITLESLLAKNNLLEHGVLLEDKTDSMAMHYRQASYIIKPLALKIMTHVFESDSAISKILKLQAGKQVLEIMPKTFSKGDCVEQLYQYWLKIAPPALCYLGDDLTDEVAFKVVNQHHGLSVYVGKPLAQTAATATLPDVEAVYLALNLLHSTFL